MGAHARSSWGAIDPEPRPPLSAVPRPTMAGAFYPKSAGPPFSQTTSATTSRPSKTTYNAQIYRLALLVGDSKAKEQFFLDSFSVIPVSGKNVQKKKSFARIPPLWSVELASDWNRPSRWLDRKSRAMTEIVVSVGDLSLSQCSKGRRWRENAREGGSIPHLAGPRGDATGDDHPRKHQIVVLSAAHRKMLKLTYNYKGQYL